MTEREAFDINERKIQLMDRDNWTCQVCGLRCNSSVIVHGREERELVCEILDLIDSD